MWNFLDWIWRKAQLVGFNRNKKSLNIRKENINSRAIFWFHKSLDRITKLVYAAILVESL